MDENLKDQEVLLVKDDVGEKLNVVAGISDDGTLKKVSPIRGLCKIIKFHFKSDLYANFLKFTINPIIFRSVFHMPSSFIDLLSLFLTNRHSYTRSSV